MGDEVQTAENRGECLMQMKVQDLRGRGIYHNGHTPTVDLGEQGLRALPHTSAGRGQGQRLKSPPCQALSSWVFTLR